MKQSRIRYGIDVSSIHREIRDPLWPRSMFRILTGIDTRRLSEEISGILRGPGDNGGISLAEIRLGGSASVQTWSFHHNDRKLEPFLISKARKLPVLLDLLKGLTRQYSLSVAVVHIVGSNSGHSDYEIGREAQMDRTGDLLTLAARGELAASVSVGTETVRCTQGAMWCIPEARHVRVSSDEQYVHVHFDVRPTR